MRVARLKEIDRLEHSLATLATVGSTSPYVGLFGTVWGIMNAFTGLGNVQQATLAMVAPGISEALVATAIGLFAAIPAVVAFNRFADQVGRLEVRYAAFMEEFSTILQRHASRPGTPAAAAESNRRSRARSLTDGATSQGTTPDGRDQRRAVHRRDAGAADHLHGDGAAAHAGREGGSAEGVGRTAAAGGAGAAGAVDR